MSLMDRLQRSRRRQQLPNITPDLGPDTAPDATPDAAHDVAPNVLPDVHPDVAPDLTPAPHLAEEHGIEALEPEADMSATHETHAPDTPNNTTHTAAHPHTPVEPGIQFDTDQAVLSSAPTHMTDHMPEHTTAAPAAMPAQETPDADSAEHAEASLHDRAAQLATHSALDDNDFLYTDDELSQLPQGNAKKAATLAFDAPIAATEASLQEQLDEAEFRLAEMAVPSSVHPVQGAGMPFAAQQEPDLSDPVASSDAFHQLLQQDGPLEMAETEEAAPSRTAARLRKASRPFSAATPHPALTTLQTGQTGQADNTAAETPQDVIDTAQADQAVPSSESSPQASPGPVTQPEQEAPQTGEVEREEQYYTIKAEIHERLIELLDLSIVESLPPEKLRKEIGKLTERLLREEFRQAPLNAIERRDMVKEIQDEVLGLGPLEPLLQDPTISDILVNNYKMVYVERKGKLHQVKTRFRDDDHLRKIIDRIVAQVGRRVDESSPMVDARLADGSRVNAIIPPLALDGPSLSIRRFSRDPLELQDLINFNALTREIGEVLQGIVKARLNIIVSGGTGSGKTTMLNCLSRFVPHDERVVTIEDAAELQLKQDHVVRLETRPANIEGQGEVNARDLVKNCLRMRPDRIIVGEVRSSEVLDMLQAMNTGHDGSLTTIHANTPRDCLMRLETMVAMAGLNLEGASMKRYIASAVDAIVQVSRLSDGSRKLTSLQEITGMEGETVTMQEIFAYRQYGIDENGKVIGQFESTGIRPKFAERLKAMGVELDGSLFDPTLGTPEGVKRQGREDR